MHIIEQRQHERQAQRLARRCLVAYDLGGASFRELRYSVSLLCRVALLMGKVIVQQDMLHCFLSASSMLLAGPTEAALDLCIKQANNLLFGSAVILRMLFHQHRYSRVDQFGLSVEKRWEQEVTFGNGATCSTSSYT